MISSSGILSKSDIQTIYDYYKQIDSQQEYADKYKKYCVYATNCPIMFEYATEYELTHNRVNSPTHEGVASLTKTNNLFFTNISDAYFTIAYYLFYTNITCDESIKYFEKASALNNDCASFNLSMYYESKNNKKLQLSYLTKSIEHGNILAISKFVILNRINYFSDCLIPSIDATVFNLTHEMCWHIGCYFENKYNIDSMLLFFKIASDKGNKESTYKLAKFYQNEMLLVRMAKYYKRLADDFNEMDAMKELVKYYKGRGFYKQMVKYYKEMAKLGDVNSNYELALHYKIRGEEKRMIEFFEKAMSCGNYFAKYDLEKYFIEKLMGEKLFDLYKSNNFKSETRFYEFFMALKQYDGVDEFQCPINLSFCKKGFVTNCGHTFSYELLFIKSNVCPLCRSCLDVCEMEIQPHIILNTP